MSARMTAAQRRPARSLRLLRLLALSYVVGAAARTVFELGAEANWNPATLLAASPADVGTFLVWNLFGFTVWRPVGSAPGNLAVGLVALALARWWRRTRG